MVRAKGEVLIMFQQNQVGQVSWRQQAKVNWGRRVGLVAGLPVDEMSPRGNYYYIDMLEAIRGLPGLQNMPDGREKKQPAGEEEAGD